MQKVVILSAFLRPFRSGAEACAEEVAVRLRGAYDITIVTARMRRELPRKDMLRGTVPMVRVGIGHPIDKWLFPLLAPMAARRLRPNLVHAILETFAGAALLVCRFVLPGARRLLTLQTTNRSFLKEAIIRSADHVTAISSVLATQAQEAGRQAVLIPNGIDTAMLEHARTSTAKIPGRVLFVGRLEPMKGVDTLLRALHVLLHTTSDFSASLAVTADDPVMPTAHSARRTVHVRIVGDGSERARLERLANELGIDDITTFAGRVEPGEIAAEYATAEIFCGLSRSEALGNVFLEAQAAGCAVIGTRVGGIPDSVQDGATGLLVQPDQPEEAAAAILRLLRDDALRTRLALAGRTRATGYDWDGIALRYGETWERLSASS